MRRSLQRRQFAAGKLSSLAVDVRTYDLDGNGSIDFDEFAQAIESQLGNQATTAMIRKKDA